MVLCLADRRRRLAVILEAFHDDIVNDMGSVPFADNAGLFDAFYGGGHGHGEYGLVSQLGASSTSPLVLDGAGGLMDAAAASTEEEAPKRKGDHHRRDDKAAMALKNHSEAERRRRERINAHLATLRTMVPCSDKVSASVSFSRLAY